MTAPALPTSNGPGTAPRQSLAQSRPRNGEGVIRVVLMAAALVSVATTVGIVIALVEPTIEFFREVNVGDFLFGTDWAPLFADAQFGVVPLVKATFLVTVIALVVAIPFGMGAAVYLSEYAKPGSRRVLKPALEVLAGIPTVVYGVFALTAVTPALRHLPFIGDKLDVFNALSAGLVMGIMIIPTIASLSEDAMSAVPRDLRDGGYALGSSRMQVSQRIVVPAALSGIVAACVLGVSRAIGETMIVAVAAGGQPNMDFNILHGMQTMTAFIAAAGIGDQPTGSTGYKTIFAVGALLFVITLVMNLFSIRMVRRFREVYE